jgi:hypothetical protein
VPGDAKALVKLRGAKSILFMASQNKDSLKIFSHHPADGVWHVVPGDLEVKAELTFSDGRKEVVEIYYGSGYLSQSTRTLTVPRDVSAVTFFDSRGNTRRVSPIP